MRKEKTYGKAVRIYSWIVCGITPAAAFWLFYSLPGVSVELYEGQEEYFRLWLAALAVLGALPLLRRGDRRWVPAVWCLSALCWGMTGLRTYTWAWAPNTGTVVPYSTHLGSIYVPLGQASWAMALAALVLCALWVLLQCVRFTGGERGAEEVPEGEHPEE